MLPFAKGRYADGFWWFETGVKPFFDGDSGDVVSARRAFGLFGLIRWWLGVESNSVVLAWDRSRAWNCRIYVECFVACVLFILHAIEALTVLMLKWFIELMRFTPIDTCSSWFQGDVSVNSRENFQLNFTMKCFIISKRLRGVRCNVCLKESFFFLTTNYKSWLFI